MTKNLIGILVVSLCLAGNPVAAAESLEVVIQRANQGDADAQYLVGATLFSGKYGDLKDQAQAHAATWFRAAAEQGHAKAQLALGNMYFNGFGIPQNYVEAAKWYSKAAEQGDELAQFGVGLIYRDGLGVPKDKALAYMWFNISSVKDRTREKAGTARDEIAKYMTRDQIAEAERMTREWMAVHLSQ